MGNREKVLDAAAAAFARNGYGTTSLDEILDAARVAPSNFYYHFKSKEELAFQVLDRYFERARQEIAPLFMNRRLGPMQKLEQLHRHFVARMSENGCSVGCPLGNLAQELSDRHVGFRRKLAEFFEECMEEIAHVVRKGVEIGEIRKEIDPGAAAYLLFGSIEGLILLSKNLKDVAPLEEGFRQALALLRAC